MTAPTTDRARRKAARELLRDAQLPELGPRSRAVLTFKAIRLCTTASLDFMEACIQGAAWTDDGWQTVQDVLTASAKRMLKTR